MAYNDFTLELLKQRFGLQTEERHDHFAKVDAVPISDALQIQLNEGVPLAIAIGTEKARSELIVAPVLLETRRQSDVSVSFFSGTDFTVDPERGLRGTCDFMFSLSPEQLVIEAPVVTVVEVKNDNLRQGINQCIAELVAAQTFNESRGNAIRTVYGVVTTGTNWQFLRLAGTTVSIDRSEYYIPEVGRIVGIMLSMLRTASAEANGSVSATEEGTHGR